MRDELLRSRGWVVATIPFWEWDKLGSMSAKMAYLRATLPSCLLQHDLPAKAHGSVQEAKLTTRPTRRKHKQI